jgi:hypothetical protein
MGTWLGREEEGEASGQKKQKPAPRTETDDWTTDDGLRFTLAQSSDVDSKGIGHKGRRMNKHEFFQQIKGLDAKGRRDVVQQTDAPSPVKEVAKEEAKKEEKTERRLSAVAAAVATDTIPETEEELDSESVTESQLSSEEETDTERPNVAASVAKWTRGTSAQERRSNLSPAPPRARLRRDSDDDGTERIPPSALRQAAGLTAPPRERDDDTGETPAERRRRLAALGHSGDTDSESDDDEAVEEDSDSEDDGEPRLIPPTGDVQSTNKPRASDPTSPSGEQSSSSGSGSMSRHTPGHRPRVSWGGEKGR